MNFEYKKTVKDVEFIYAITGGEATLSVAETPGYENKRLTAAQRTKALQQFQQDAKMLAEYLIGELDFQITFKPVEVDYNKLRTVMNVDNYRLRDYK